jgi:Major Facilitator Superfamily
MPLSDWVNKIEMDSQENQVIPSIDKKTNQNPHQTQSTHDQSNVGPQDATPVFKPGKAFLMAFMSVCITTLAAALDATSLSVALPTITERLHGSAIEAFWSGTSFLVTSAVFQPVIAGLSHVFGRKQLVLISAALFAIGSLIAALAVNFTMMWVLWLYQFDRN